jgi:hypothetical protein
MGKKTYQRPSGWERTIKRSYWDENKDYTGEEYDEEEKAKAERERKEKAEKAGKGRFGKLLKRIVGGE